MAAAAEQLQYLDVGELPLLATARDNARQAAGQTIEFQRQQLRTANYEAVPLPIDALSSATSVREARSAYGDESPEADERYRGLRLDCQRLLAEAARKNTYEYFPPLLQEFDTGKGEYFSHGFSISSMTEAGLTPLAEPEELDRRINERVEEATYQAIGRLALASPAAPQRIRTISECPDWAIEAHQNRSKGGYGGYVPEIQKFMIRDVVFDPLSGDRYEEQVGLPGLHITHDIITGLLESRGLTGATSLTKTELHARQFEAGDDLLDFVSALDTAASIRHSTHIFMGEVANRPGSYEAVPEAAGQRQAALDDKARCLADTIVELSDSGIDRLAASGIVDKQVENILFEIASRDTVQAEVMFDRQTARGLEEVNFLRLMGEYGKAEVRLEQVKDQAPAPSYCGAGSCGLENIGLDSAKAATMKEMGMDSSKSLKDTERRCPRCSKKDIVYDLKNKIKGCTSCRSTTGFGKSSK